MHVTDHSRYSESIDDARQIIRTIVKYQGVSPRASMFLARVDDYLKNQWRVS